MRKWKFAILEDDKAILKDIVEKLRKISSIEVVCWARTSDDFIEKVRENPPDVLILDIELRGDSKTGLDVAALLKKPVLFISGNTRDNITGLEELNYSFANMPVEHLSKPVTDEKLLRAVHKFIALMKGPQKETVRLSFIGEGSREVDVNSVAVITTDKNHGAESGNKIMYFNNRKPGVIANISFKQLAAKGFQPPIFIQTERSVLANKNVIAYSGKGNIFSVWHQDGGGKSQEFKYAVSDNYRSILKKELEIF